MASPPQEGGPDGSSLRPVSSLRAKFENMHTTPKLADSNSSSSPPSHPHISPAPKPDRLRDLKTGQDSIRSGAPSPPPPPPKPRLENKDRDHAPAPSSSQLSIPLHENGGPRSPGRLAGPPPPLSPKPVKPMMPSVMIDPPQSPPKPPSNQKLVAPETSSHLHVDANAPAIASPTIPPRPFKIPSRSSTPVLEPGKSPRLPGSQPPSPPPPRRSGEVRRDAKQPPPPPVSRGEKSSATAQPRPSLQADRPTIPIPEPKNQNESSPFSSPPSSPETPSGETPPLPSRPKQHPHDAHDTPRIQTLDVGFEPPPRHHSIVARGREMESRHHSHAAVPNDHPPPSLPARPRTTAEPPPNLGPAQLATAQPPPRPPKQGAMPPTNPDNSFSPPKRVVSTPATGFLPPPTRVPARSGTVTDRRSERPALPEARGAAQQPQHVAPQQVPPQPVAASPAVTSAQPPASKPGEPQVSGYPDPSNVNRRPPYIKQGVHEVAAKFDTRVFDVCGDLVCTTGAYTRVWSLRDGEMLMSFAHGEGVKATAIAFKPGTTVDEEGKRIWIGNNMGEILEADIATQAVVAKKTNAHQRFEITKFFRHFNELWSMDESGGLVIWGPGEDYTPNLEDHPHQTYRLPRNHAFSMVVGDELWHATGKEIRVFAPTLTGETQFQVLVRPLMQENTGDVSSGTTMRTQPGKAFFGHVDGKVSIYQAKDYSCLAVLSVSSFKINTMTGVGKYIWAGFNNGQLSVYDIDQSPWVVKKNWTAHENPVVKMISDPSSCYRLDRLQVISLGADNMVRAWDGLLSDDWQESHMKAQETSYCHFEDLKAMIMTWNAGACTPHSLRYSDQDSVFIQNLLESSDSPDILVFGFQELVDLEDKRATAKRLFKSKKKEGSDQERMSHQYRDWRDFLLKSLDDLMPSDDLYHLLHTGHLVGLFTCIFVKASIRDRVRNLVASEVKRGMGGLHGNKGAIVIRFMVDDTSMCFINCHLAAGQSQANSRHNDVAAILESSILPAERDPNIRIDSYTGGGDGSMILDHEMCLLNGDLNYRIDTMSRDTVVMAVKQKNLAKLLERDQLLVARRRNPSFRLRAFEEMPITFAPTYKYDVGTDSYDTSEKRRAPAWCDRVLYRADRGRIEQLDYVRHEVRVSDHRPVSARFKFTVKKIEPKARAMAWMDCQVQFEDVRAQENTDEKMAYLTHTIGYDLATAKSLVKPRKDRSPSRTRA